MIKELYKIPTAIITLNGERVNEYFFAKIKNQARMLAFTVSIKLEVLDSEIDKDGERE